MKPTENAFPGSNHCFRKENILHKSIGHRKPYHLCYYRQEEMLMYRERSLQTDGIDFRPNDTIPAFCLLVLYVRINQLHHFHNSVSFSAGCLSKHVSLRTRMGRIAGEGCSLTGSNQHLKLASN